MVDVTHLAAIQGATSINQSHTSWGIRFGRHQIEVTRKREARIIGRYTVPVVSPRMARPIWPIAIGTFASVSAFGLFVFGAVASEPLLPGNYSHYLVSVPVPGRANKVSVAVPSRRVTGSRAKTIVAVPVASGPRFDTEDEPYVTKALNTGEFQEWLGSDGQRRFLNAGPEQAGEGGRCRDLALLVRQADGSSHARNARRCISNPTSSSIPDANIGEMDQASPLPTEANGSRWIEPTIRIDESAVERITQ